MQQSELTGDFIGGDRIGVGNISDSKAVAIGAGAIALSQTFGTGHVEPIQVKTLKIYLLKAGKAVTSANVNEKLAQLYGMPVRVRRVGSGNSEGIDLVQTVSDLFREGNPDLRLQRVVILGDSGSGKTVALQHLRRARARRSEAALGKPGNESEVVLPILISLSNLQTGASIKELIQESLNHVLSRKGEGERLERVSIGQVDLLLQDYKILFLLDGLEDVPAQNGVQLVRRFMETEDKHDYVITCTSGAYRRQLGSVPNLLAIDDLSEEEVKRILGENGYNKLNPALRPLVRNRSHLKSVIELDPEQSLAQVRSRGQLLRSRYAEEVRSGPGNQGSQTVNPDMLELFVEQLAYSILRSGTLTLSEYELMQHIQKFIEHWHEPYSWRQVADQLRVGNGILRRDEMQRWAFKDKTILASFAATACLHVPIPELMEGYENTFLWRETLSLLIGLLPDESTLCYQLIDRDVFTAASCVGGSGREVQAGVINAVIDVFVERVAHGSAEQRRHVVLQLGESGHPRAINGLLRILQREWSSYVMAGIVWAIAAWLQSDSSRKLADIPAFQKIDVTTGQVLQHCLDELLSPGAPANHADYYQKVIEDPTSTAHARGLAAIGLGLMQDPAGCDLLVDLFKRSTADESLRWHVVEALTSYSSNEKVIQAIREMYAETQPAEGLTDADPRRSQAVYLLGWLQCHSDTEDILNKALSDNDANVRGRAVEAMGRLDLLNSRQRIEEVLINDPDPFVVRMAAEALGAIGDVASIATLERSLNNEAALTRWSVQQAIREIRERQSM